MTRRHHSIRNRLARVLERVNGTSATVEPRGLKPQDSADQWRGKAAGTAPAPMWVLDVGVVCPGTQRCVDQGDTTPGLAAEAYAAVKAAKYADQDNFIPFILEMDGRVNKPAREWLDTPSQAKRRPVRTTTTFGTGRTTTERVVREAMQKLGRVQAHMLARMVVEIRSTHLAVEEEPHQ